MRPDIGLLAARKGRDLHQPAIDGNGGRGLLNANVENRAFHDGRKIRRFDRRMGLVALFDLKIEIPDLLNDLRLSAGKEP
ncbi:hypothetical protein [Oryzifoliimicrobium ureilyticus]|uniref:hypothetical protein n=1 Tax=Oryzifoliimicrobium ureilyticus TaxID=3113724 RepID=UPI003F67A493